MELLAIVGLIVAVGYLWRRLDRVEGSLAALEWRVSEVADSGPVTQAPPPQDEFPPEDVQPLHVPDIPKLVPSWEPVEESHGESLPEEPDVARSGYLPKLTFDFEDIFGRRLPIWAGGIALALAGIFLVRFSIEAGLLTPQVRVTLSFVFGLVLLAGAEAAYRLEERIRDTRVRQALAGAGLATLYAGFYLAGSHYGLIASGASFVGLAAVTAAAIGFSFRFGLPCAVLGLAGGFAAPALVASEEANVPILTLYLALVTAGLAVTGQRQGRPWLGFAALAFGFLWGTALLVSDFDAAGDIAAFGLYLVLLGAAVPLLAGGTRAWPRLAAAALASLQMAALIDVTGQGPLAWALYLLLGAALAALGWREQRLREVSAFAAALGLWLLLFWNGVPLRHFAPVTAGMAAVFIAVPTALVLLDRTRQLDLWQVSLAAPALTAVFYYHFGRWDTAGSEPALAAVALALALPPALAARHEWNHGADERLLTVPLSSAAMLMFAALLMVVPAWAAPVAGTIVCLALVELARRRATAPLLALAWGAALTVAATLAVTPGFIAESGRLAGYPAESGMLRAVVRWVAAGLPFLALAWLEGRWSARRLAEGLLALAAYGAIAQVLPADSLAWACSLVAIAAIGWLPRRDGAWALLLAVPALWAAEPLIEWAVAGSSALVGVPMLMDGLPSSQDTLLRLVPLFLAAAYAAWRVRDRNRIAASWLAAGAAAVGCVAAHVLYKQVFSIETAAEFVGAAVAERTVWQALLAGSGLALLARRMPLGLVRTAATALLALSLAHFAWFTLLLHNPLWSEQAVGPWPILNWLLPAYGIAAAALVAGKSLTSDRAPMSATIADAALMTLIALFALSELRQLHAGSLLTGSAVGQGEDLQRSLLGIVLAIAFLAWGARRQRRDWRIGSLVLMLLAVGKVFLVDAAGLEGLLRVASFMALGFSLIGIGWVYSRQLRMSAAAPVTA